MNRSYSAEEWAYIEQHYTVMLDREIAEKLGRTSRAIQSARASRGLMHRRGRPGIARPWNWKSHEVELLKTKYGSVALSDLAAALGKSVKSVDNRRRRLGIPAFMTAREKPEPKPKVTKEQRRAREFVSRHQAFLNALRQEARI